MARKYPMTTEEIVASYRQAKSPQLQIGVLADLNVCTRREIRQVLEEAGALKASPAAECGIKGGRPATFDTALARQLFERGLTDAEIAAQVGIPAVRLARWRQRVGLYRHGAAEPAGQPARRDAGADEAEAEKPVQDREKEAQDVKKQSEDTQEVCAVTVKGLRVLLEAAESAGYGEAPVVMAGRRFSAMHLRVETLIGAETRGELVELVPDTPQ